MLIKERTYETKIIVMKGKTIPRINIFERIRRISLCLLSAKKKKASMSVEAALVMPLFMFAMINLNSFMDMYNTSIKESFKLYEEVRVAAAGSYALDMTGIDLESDIVLSKLYDGKPAISIMGFDKVSLVSIFYAKPWNGFNTEGEGANQEEEDTVFITPSGEAYHQDDRCPYLKLSIRMANREDIDQERNLNGEKYEKCSKCGNANPDLTFVTNYGNVYHTSLDCSSLKRTIIEVKVSEVEGRHACQKCFGGM